MKPGSMLREVKVEQAVGMVLAHDLTQIVPGRFKGRLFKKGHVVREEDIPKLLEIGKEHLYIIQLEPGYLHEDEAALRMGQALAGNDLDWTQPSEGKVSIKSPIHGLVKINRSLVDEVNRLGEVALATLRTNTVVRLGQPIAATRVIPLIVQEDKIQQVEQIAAAYRSERGDPLEVKPFRRMKAGLLTTGSEVFTGRIEDRFGPVVRAKLEEFGSEVVEQRFAPDDSDVIVQHIRHFLSSGCEMILVTGGMSVDPDDRTPGAIRQAGAEVISYGTPMLPGSMLMMAYIEGVPVLGLPGCVMHDPYTSFDVLLPRILAGEAIGQSDITELGYGGLHNC